MTVLQISLDDHQKAFVEAQAAEEGHGTAADYVLALLRDAERRKAWRHLEQLALEGLDTPEEEMTEKDWEMLGEIARKPKGPLKS